MRPVIYSMSVSLDGFIAGPRGEIDWSPPDEELHRFHNQQTRAIGAQVCGRGVYETMLVWETMDTAHASPVRAEFAEIWRPIPKVVFSTTLQHVEGNARLATSSLADEVARLRDQPDDREVRVGGTPYFAPLDRRLDLELLE